MLALCRRNPAAKAISFTGNEESVDMSWRHRLPSIFPTYGVIFTWHRCVNCLNSSRTTYPIGIDYDMLITGTWLATLLIGKQSAAFPDFGIILSTAKCVFAKPVASNCHVSENIIFLLSKGVSSDMLLVLCILKSGFTITRHRYANVDYK